MTEPAPYINNQRYYANPNYLLPSDDNERRRLDLQHKVIKRAFGDQLLPHDASFKPGDQILDSGTGTGSWALDVAPSLPPGVSIVASDIESRLFPTNAPDNISFTVASILSLPLEWSSKFTLVHQRLLMAALGVPQWKTALDEMYRVLKPGGLIRLVEASGIRTASGSPVIAAELPHTHKHGRIFEKLYAAHDMRTEPGAFLPGMLKDVGFEIVDQEDKLINAGPGEACKDARVSFIGAIKGMKGPVFKLGGFGIVQTEEEWDTLMEDLEEEWEANAVGWAFIGITARKPYVPVE